MTEVRPYLFDDFETFVFHCVVADAMSHLFGRSPPLTQLIYN